LLHDLFISLRKVSSDPKRKLIISELDLPKLSSTESNDGDIGITPIKQIPDIIKPREKDLEHRTIFCCACYPNSKILSFVTGGADTSQQKGIVSIWQIQNAELRFKDYLLDNSFQFVSLQLIHLQH
jgi:hypothetical protein